MNRCYRSFIEGEFCLGWSDLGWFYGGGGNSFGILRLRVVEFSEVKIKGRVGRKWAWGLIGAGN